MKTLFYSLIAVVVIVNAEVNAAEVCAMEKSSSEEVMFPGSPLTSPSSSSSSAKSTPQSTPGSSPMTSPRLEPMSGQLVCPPYAEPEYFTILAQQANKQLMEEMRKKALEHKNGGSQ